MASNQFQTALGEAYPLLLGMGSSLQAGQGAGPGMQQGLAMMMALKDRKEQKAREDAEKAREAQMQSEGLRLTSMALGGGAAPMTFNGGREEFISTMMPHAQRVSQATGLDPRLVIAQAALETGFGKSAPGNNYFGIKSHGQPGGNMLATTEYEDGARLSTRDSFRQYGGMGESADGYAAFLQQNPRYQQLLASEGLDAQLAALGQSGYATDPNYAAKVGQIARSIGGQRSFSNMTPERAAQALQNPHVPNVLKQQIMAQFQPQQAQKPTTLRQNVEWIQSQNPGMTFREALSVARGDAGPQDEYGRYAAEEVAAGRNPLSRIDYAQAKKGKGTIVYDPTTGKPLVSIGGGKDDPTDVTQPSSPAAMISSIDGILNDPALDFATGWLEWTQNIPGTGSKRFGARAQQLEGQAFLQAFESLKGGGHITEIEGQKATQAIGRLSTAQGPEDYRTALMELRGILDLGMQRKSGNSPKASAADSGSQFQFESDSQKALFDRYAPTGE